MKMRWPITFAVLVAAFLFSLSTDGADSETGWAGYVQLEVREALQKPKPHPRLLATADDFARLRASTNELVRLGCERLLFDAGEMRSFPLPIRRLEGRRLLTVSQRALSRILTLAFAYRLTDNDRFVRRAIEEAEAVCAFRDWNPDHFLDTAEMTLAVALVYDWLYDVLTVEQRATLRKGLLKNGLREPNGTPKTGGWVNAANNWGQVCHAGLVAGAIALMDEEPALAEKILVRAATALPRPMQAFAPAGGFPEGPAAYWPYAMSFNVVALEAFTKALGTDFGLANLRGFRESADYLDSVTGPTGRFFNYADASVLPDQKKLSMRAPEMASFWLARRFDRADTLVRWELPLYRAYCKDRTPPHPTPRRVLNRLMPLTLLWLEPPAKKSPSAELPLCRLIPGRVPIAVQRSGWDKSDWFVGLKGGSPSSPHGHMDGGSFVLDAKGVRWASDLGSEDYHRMEASERNLWDMSQNSDRWKIFRLGAASHNIFRLNGGQQYVGGSALFVSFTNAPVAKAVMDVKGLYPGVAEATRTGTLVPGGGYFLQDHLAGVTKGTVLRWQMVTPARVKSNEKNELVLVQRGPDGEDVEMKITASDRWARWTTEALEGAAGLDESPNPGFTLVYFQLLVPESGTLDYTVRFE